MLEEQFYETVAVTAVLPKVKAALLEPQWPQLFIIAPVAGDGMSTTVYAVEKAPAWAFDAWVFAVGGVAFDFVQVAKTLRVDRSVWEIHQRWQVINEMAENLGEVGVRLPLYTSRIDARRALCAMEGM